MKTRGRPVGSEKDDGKVLEAIADMIFADHTLKPTRAMRHNNSTVTDTEVRRFQAKWKAKKEILLLDAQRRSEAKAAKAQVSVARSAPRRAKDFMQQMEDTFNSPVMRMARGLHPNPAIQAAIEFHTGPAMRAITDVQNSLAMAARYDFENGTAMKAIRAFHNSPVERLVRQLSADDRIARMARGLP